MVDEKHPEAPPEEGVPAAAEEDEFAGLSPPPPRRSPLVSLAVLAIACILVVRLLPDARYALSRRVPTALGAGRGFDPAAAARYENQMVSLDGLPDYRNALLFEPKGDNYRRAFFRMLGTGSRLWVRAEQTATRHDLGPRIEGRLLRFDAIAYGDQVRRYYAEKVRVTRALDLDATRRLLAAGPLPDRLEVPDRAGEKVVVADRAAGGHELVVVEIFPDDLVITLPRLKFPVEEDARHEAERLGAPIRPAGESKDAFAYVATMGAARRDAFIALLEQRGFGFRLHREEHRGPLAGLTRDESGRIVLPADGGGAPAPIDLARVESIAVAEPVAIPADAWIVIENEFPEDFRWVLLLDGFLAIFALFNFWLLIRPLARRKTPGARPAPGPE